MSSVTFEMKREFSASQDLLSTRSRFLKLPETGTQRDIFSIKPPDFYVKLYRHRIVSRKKDKKTFSDAGIRQPHEPKMRSEIFFPNIIIPTPKKDSPKFITSHKPPDGLQCQLMFVKMGKFPTDPYRKPKPHNFRLLDEALPDIKTECQRNPGNMDFKLKHLDTLKTSRSELSMSFKDQRTQSDICKPAEPKWDPELILPPLP